MAIQALTSDLRIGEWTVEPALNQLSAPGRAVKVEPKAMEVLVYLAERAGKVASRDELLDAVWRGAVVGDDALTQVVIKLRKALGDSYIETIPKRGYRLIAPVTRPDTPVTPRVGSRKVRMAKRTSTSLLYGQQNATTLPAGASNAASSEALIRSLASCRVTASICCRFSISSPRHCRRRAATSLQLFTKPRPVGGRSSFVPALPARECR
jgi:DNA-binding winged helix-turn-helix (wHTH) protein